MMKKRVLAALLAAALSLSLVTPALALTGREEAAQAAAPAGGAARPGAPKKRAPGSIAFVPSAAGLVLAGEVIRDLALPGQ